MATKTSDRDLGYGDDFVCTSIIQSVLMSANKDL
jgi:hypothetical protein